ncbi:MAG: hypothetical protein EOO75_18465 [Myxococcales bacterium]|nr:MAG: hypothetical protein EOO75_18465 [Myxococcales bacterium]
MELAQEETWPLTPAPIRPLHPTFAEDGPGSYFVADPDGWLVWLQRAHRKVTGQMLIGDVRALETVQFSVIVASVRDQHVTFARCHADGRDELLDARVLAEGAVFFGHADGLSRHPLLGLCAVERPIEGDWAVYCRLEGVSYMPIEAPRQGRVVGVCHDGRMPALLVLDDGDTHLLRWGPGGAATVARTRSPIVSVAVAEARPQLAYLCLDGLLVVRAYAYEQPLLQVHHDAS